MFQITWLDTKLYRLLLESVVPSTIHRHRDRFFAIPATISPPRPRAAAHCLTVCAVMRARTCLTAHRTWRYASRDVHCIDVVCRVIGSLLPNPLRRRLTQRRVATTTTARHNVVHMRKKRRKHLKATTPREYSLDSLPVC